MSTRRSTRVRARSVATDDATTTALTVSDVSEPAVPRGAKRARKNAVEKTPAVAETVTLEWVQDAMPQSKRDAWDAFCKAQLYLHQPHDLYDVFALAVHVNPENPLDAFLETAGLRLTGPFVLLARGGTSVRPVKPLYLHGRFALDPPEVISVFEDTESTAGAHWGLYRDKPSESPSYIVHTADANACAFEPVAVSLFSVLCERLRAAQSKTNKGHDNDTSIISQLRLVESYIKSKGESSFKSAGATRTQRAQETLATSLHGLGILVPYDTKKRSGYRELPIVGDALRDLLNAARSGDASAKKKLTNLITRATIANDECDFGTSLLLGLDLFTAGPALQKEALQMLRVAYMLLGRKEFAKVASDHVRDRIEGITSLNCLPEETNATNASTHRVELP